MKNTRGTTEHELHGPGPSPWPFVLLQIVGACAYGGLVLLLWGHK